MLETVTDTKYAASDDWQRAWAPMIAAAGEDFGGSPRTAIDEVERGAVRKFLEPLEYDNPLHYDEAVARRFGYRGIVAPYSGISSVWLDSGQWEPGSPTNYPNADPNYDNVRGSGGRGERRPVDPANAHHAHADDRRLPAPPTNGRLASELEFEYLEPVCVGDRLTSVGNRLISVTPRETKFGRGAFTVMERQVLNQRGEIVARLRQHNYAYVRNPGAGRSEETPRPYPPPTGPIMEAFPPREPLPPFRQADWGKQLTFESVREGDEVPPIVFHVTICRMVVFSGAVRIFGQIHHNTTVTQAQGAPDIYMGVSLIQGVWERMVGEYIGLAGRVKTVGPFRIKMYSPVGESVISKGIVKRKWVENGEHLVELEVWCEHSHGISVGPGSIVVALPSAT